MSPRNYLLDENLSKAYRRALNRHNPEMVVWQIGDAGAPPLGTADPDILRWCEQICHERGLFQTFWR